VFSQQGTAPSASASWFWFCPEAPRKLDAEEDLRIEAKEVM